MNTQAIYQFILLLPYTRRHTLFVIANCLILTTLLALTACSSEKPSALRIIESNLVCMGTDQVPGKSMIPIEVDGKTYYGCCPKCNERLLQDKNARMAIDPVSGEVVDKADALIVEDLGGMALYFKSTETVEKYLGEEG